MSQIETRCDFNPIGVFCVGKDRKCRKCGWNPVVELERKERLRREFGAEKKGEPWYARKRA